MAIRSGTYRGVVVDNRDPSGLNRIRVLVPQRLGQTASGWAWPAWTMDDMSVWPADRFPKVGNGVWVRFEGADRMAWIGTYGLPEPAQEDPPDVYVTKVMWNLPYLVYNVSTKIFGAKGSVWSKSGTPNPEPTVTLMANYGTPASPAPPPDAPEEEKWIWTDLATTDVELDGSWSLMHTRTNPTANQRYMVRFNGTGPFPPASSPVKEFAVPSADTTVVWTSGLPKWKTSVYLQGTVSTPEGIPSPCRIDLMISSDGGPFVLSQSVQATAAGTWSMFHTRTDAAPLDMKMVFVGHDNWKTGESWTEHLEKIESTPAITWDLPGKTMRIGVPVSFAGTLTSEYGTPTNNTVHFQTKADGASSFTTRSSHPVNANGQWSVSNYAPDLLIADYRMHYTAQDIWKETMTETHHADIRLTTTTTLASVQSILYHGGSFTVTGTVIDQDNKPVTKGQVELWWWRTTGPAAGQVPRIGPAAVNLSATGTYTISFIPTAVGVCAWEVRYKGDGGSFLPSTSASQLRTTALQHLAALTKGLVSTTSVEFSWPAVSGATAYEVFQGINNGTPTYYSLSNSGLSHYLYYLAPNTVYGYQVRARATDSAGAYVYATLCPQIKMTTAGAGSWY